MNTSKIDKTYHPIEFKSIEEVNFALFGADNSQTEVFDLIFKSEYGKYIRKINTCQCGQRVMVTSYEKFDRSKSEWVFKRTHFPLTYQVKSMKLTLMIGALTGLEPADPDDKDYPKVIENMGRFCNCECPCFRHNENCKDRHLKGMFYEPFDNSFVIRLSGNVKNGRGNGLYYISKRYHDPIEEDADFVIVSEPYQQTVFSKLSKEPFERTFVNVISTKTGNVYRTKYSPTFLKHR